MFCTSPSHPLDAEHAQAGLHPVVVEVDEDVVEDQRYRLLGVEVLLEARETQREIEAQSSVPSLSAPFTSTSSPPRLQLRRAFSPSYSTSNCW